MVRFVKFGITSALLFVLSGCAGTVKFDNDLSKNLSSPDKTTIKVRRSGSWAGGGIPAGVQDATTKMGELGPGGEIAWNRKPGYVAVVATRAGNEPTHVVIFPTEAGKTYSLLATIHYAGRFTIEPEDFPKELIAYELKSESADAPLPDVWKIELERLSKQK